MTDYKQKQFRDSPEAQSQYTKDPVFPHDQSYKAQVQLLWYINHPKERKAFEDMVGYQAAYKTYIALMKRICPKTKEK